MCGTTAIQSRRAVFGAPVTPRFRLIGPQFLAYLLGLGIFAATARSDSEDILSLVKKCQADKNRDAGACAKLEKELVHCRSIDQCGAAIAILDDSRLSNIEDNRKTKAEIRSAVRAEQAKREALRAAERRRLAEKRAKDAQAIAKALRGDRDYVADVLYSDAVEGCLFLGQNSSGALSTATETDASDKFLPDLDPGLMESVRNSVGEGRVVFVVSPAFFDLNEKDWSRLYMNAATNLNKLAGGSTRGRISILFRTLDTPELRDLDFQEGLSRALFGMTVAEARPVLFALARGRYATFRGKESELAKALQKDLPLWEKARDSTDSCREFIRTNPSSPYVEDARLRIAMLAGRTGRLQDERSPAGNIAVFGEKLVQVVKDCLKDAFKLRSGLVTTDAYPIRILLGYKRGKARAVAGSFRPVNDGSSSITFDRPFVCEKSEVSGRLMTLYTDYLTLSFVDPVVSRGGAVTILSPDDFVINGHKVVFAGARLEKGDGPAYFSVNSRLTFDGKALAFDGLEWGEEK